MKVTAIIPVLNQLELFQCTLDHLIKNAQDPETTFLVLNNGSDDFPTEQIMHRSPRVIVKEFDQNIGNYPCFFQYQEAPGDILAFFHSDLIIDDPGWDVKVRLAFENDEKLGLIGFVGSNEIDELGGRGSGTMSNFQGKTHAWVPPFDKAMIQNGDTILQRDHSTWTGSPAEAHGKRITGLEKAAVVDGCAMIFRRDVLDRIEQRENFPPHHFYDRLLSCEVQELDYSVAVLGIACDHISGQTANTQSKWQETAKQWCIDHDVAFSDYENMDQRIYQEAERQWLKEYRDEKHFIPRKV